MVKFAQLVFPKPGPIVTGKFNTFATLRNSKDEDEYNARLDEYLSSKDIAWFRWNGSMQRRQGPSSFDGLAAPERRTLRIGPATTCIHSVRPRC